MAELKRLDITAAEVIPPISDSMGRNWEQPRRDEILMDSEHAAMTKPAFEKLAEYSATYPSGVYIGKMWKRNDGLFDQNYRERGGKPEWMLCWYGESDQGAGFCSINTRLILLVL